MNQRKAADPTRQAILAAAQTLFVDKGFAATSISQIAKKAKINQSLIYHHFDNKETLWKQVKAEVLGDHMTQLQDMFDADLDLQSFLIAFVSKRFRVYAERPAIARMLKWQQLEGNAPALLGTNDGKVEHMLQCLRTIQAQGHIRKELNVHHVFHLIMSTTNTAYDAYMAFADPNEKMQFMTLVIDCLYQGLK